MDFDATQVIEEQRTTNSKENDEKTRIGILRVDNAEYEIVGGYNRIGRSPLCKVVLKDPTVSNVHAEIQAGLEATFICDLKSANGTTFKGLPLKPFFFYPINDGDAVHLGRVKAVYEVAKRSEQRIDVTPQKTLETRAHDDDRKSTSPSIEDDSLIDDSDVSMVPGTVRKKKKRLFRLPEIPVDRQKSKPKPTSSPIVGESKQVAETEENDKKTDSTNIYEMETQNITDLASVDEPEATKRPRLEKCPSTLDDSIENSIYDAETQVSISTRDPIVKTKNRSVHDKDSDTDEENKIEKNSRSRKPHLIAETDDESGTDDEVGNAVQSRLTDHISDNSITDDENEFASIAKNIAEKNEQKASSSEIEKLTAKKQAESDLEMSIDEAPNEQLIVPCENKGRNFRNIADETDMDLLPTQVLDVATSTPMLNKTKGRINDSDERIDEDDDDLFGAPTQVLLEVPVHKADSSSKISHVADTDEDKLDTDDRDIYSAPTQIINISVGKADSSGKISLDDSSKDVEKNDQDFHDAPTQVFNIAISKSDSRPKSFKRDYSRKPEIKTNNQDLQDALTQILDTSSGKADSNGKISLDDSHKEVQKNDEDIHDAPTQVFDVPIGKAASRAKMLQVIPDSSKRKVETKDQDLYDAPTQEFDVTVDKADSSSKKLRLNRFTKRAVEMKDQDLHDAPTQAFDIPIDKKDSAPNILRLNRFGKRKSEMKNQDLHDAPTQMFDVPVGKPDSSSKIPRLGNDADNSKLETNDQDLHDALTQISDVSADKTDSSTIILRLGNADKNKLETNDQDLYDAPTQTFDIPVGKTNSRFKILRRNDFGEPELKINDQEDLDDAPTQRLDVPDGKTDSINKIKKTPKSEEKKKNENSKVNLDDTVTRNLGDIFGDERNNDDDLVDEPAPLLTQNLVDILRPTQSFGNSPIREANKVPQSDVDDILNDETIDNLQKSPRTRKKTTNSTGTLGFVDGQAVRSRKKLSSTASLTKQRVTGGETENIPGGKVESSASGHPPITGCDEEDDILFGLPEVKLYGTLSNPGSPASSTTSSHNDFILPITKIIEKETKKKVLPRRAKRGQRRGANLRSSIDDKIDNFESNESESPIQPIKLSLGKRKKCTNRIVDDDDDNDSDDTFDYNDLKKIADKLLASDVTTDTRVKTDNTNLTTRSFRPRKNVEKKNVNVKNQRTRKLSKKSLSLIVSDTNSECSDSEGENKKLRSTKIDKIDHVTTRKNISKSIAQGSKRAEVQNEIVEFVEKKSYATVQLTRLRENDVKTKNLNTPKVTRWTRVPSNPRFSTESPSAPPRSRGRRTLGDNAESRGAPVDERHKILFTGVKDEDYKKIVTKLGGSVVSNPPEATVLISDKIRRTFKFLCSMAQGINIVSVKWLTESNKAGRFLDCQNFILEDPVTEAKFNFKLAESLQIAQSQKLLDGYTVIITPKVNQPEINELKGMIEACDGRVLVRPTRFWDPKTVIISREDDLAAAKALLSKVPKSIKITVQSTEFILTGILRQEINLVEHKLI